MSDELIIANEMPYDRVTDKDGRWMLRHAIYDDVDKGLEIHMYLLSERAPVGTMAMDLLPTTVEFVLDSDESEFEIPINILAAMTRWAK
jgi:hypothetical protein